VKLTLTASTGKKVLIWRDRDEFYARSKGVGEEPQVCLGVDLFEVIADLTGLDLDDAAQAVEAIRLADDAQQLLDRA
jgi:hypothetical protein